MSETGSPGLVLQLALKPDGQGCLDDLMRNTRSRSPIIRDETGGTFVVTGYAEVQSILSDLDLWRDPARAATSEHFQRSFADDLDRTLPRSEASAIVLLDDPDHSRIRRPMALALRNRLNACKPKIASMIRRLVDDLPADCPFDMVSRLGRLVPIDTVGLILGVEYDRMEQFRDWSEGTLLSLNPYRTPDQQAHLDRARTEVDAYFVEQIKLREREGGDDLITDLIIMRRDGWAMTDAELRTNLAALLLGGNLTTADLISTTLFLTLKSPEHWTCLRQDPGHARTLIEETLRLEPPIDITSRIASRDIQLCEAIIQKGQALLLNLRAANRDPLVFPDPEAFQPGRHRQKPLSFGGGSHFCIGAQLARFEVEIVMQALVERFPDLRLCDPKSPGEWHSMPFFRGLLALWVQA
jgi:cytochrome P450